MILKDRVSLGNRIKTLRLESNGGKGMTQAEFASFLGVSRQHIYKLESGFTYPNINTIKKIADKMNVDFHFGFLNKPTPAAKPSADEGERRVVKDAFSQEYPDDPGYNQQRYKQKAPSRPAPKPVNVNIPDKPVSLEDVMKNFKGKIQKGLK